MAWTGGAGGHPRGMRTGEGGERGEREQGCGFASGLREATVWAGGGARQLARAGLGVWPARWRHRRTAPAVGAVQGRREEGDKDRDLFVISKFSRDSTVNQNYLLFPSLI